MKSIEYKIEMGAESSSSCISRDEDKMENSNLLYERKLWKIAVNNTAV
jgi:hypothetical protein